MIQHDEIADLLGIKLGATPLKVLTAIEKGLSVNALERVSRSLAPSDANFKFAIVSRATLARRKHARNRLSSEESDKLARIAKIWTFAVAVWGDEGSARSFLFRPHQLLEGRRPIDVTLKTEMGSTLVENILGRLQHGTAV